MQKRKMKRVVQYFFVFVAMICAMMLTNLPSEAAAIQIEKMDIVIPAPIIGKTFKTTGAYELIHDDSDRQFGVTSMEWQEYSNGKYTKMATGATFKANTKYKVVMRVSSFNGLTFSYGMTNSDIKGYNSNNSVNPSCGKLLSFTRMDSPDTITLEWGFDALKEITAASVINFPVPVKGESSSILAQGTSLNVPSGAHYTAEVDTDPMLSPRELTNGKIRYFITFHAKDGYHFVPVLNDGSGVKIAINGETPSRQRADGGIEFCGYSVTYCYDIEPITRTKVTTIAITNLDEPVVGEKADTTFTVVGANSYNISGSLYWVKYVNGLGQKMTSTDVFEPGYSYGCYITVYAMGDSYFPNKVALDSHGMPYYSYTGKFTVNGTEKEAYCESETEINVLWWSKTAKCNHTSTEVRNAKTPTCTVAGYTGDTYCKVCGVKIGTGSTIAASHIWENVYTVDQPATCYREGSKSIHCTKCTEKKNVTSIAKTAHKESGWKYDSNNHWTECTVSGCGAIIKAKAAHIDSNNDLKCDTCSCALSCTHKSTEIRNAKTATCTAEGYTGDTYCKTCGAKLKSGSSIAKKAHIESNWISDSSYHWTECTVCSTMIKAKAAHVDADLNGKCDSCDYAMAIPHTHTYVANTTSATLTKDGKIEKVCECGDISSIITVYAPKIFKLSTSKYTYDGKVKTPILTVIDSNGKTIDSKYYTLTTPGGRKNVGKYTFTVKFKGRYSGSKSVSFTIVPKGATISKLTAQSKAFTVTWAQNVTQTTGYQIQYGLKSDLSDQKTVTITSNKTTSKKISSLKAKKKYYVRIRTYKTVNGTKYYSSWSAKKTITTK